MKYLGILFSIPIVLSCLNLSAQKLDRDLDYWRPPDQRGVNMFEPGKDHPDSLKFEKLKVRVGGAFALQFQGLQHSNESDPVFSDPADPTFNANRLMDISNNFNLATANLDIDVALEKGLRLHLRTYLSSRHHPEAWVKGGYLQIDRLDFIKDGFMSNIMDKVSVKIGHMQINYGDQQFRRTDNGQALLNPFVGNYIMDAFTTEIAAEIYYFNKGLMLMGGLSNGRLNQTVANADGAKPVLLLKAAYDDQSASGFRYRFAGSLYSILGETTSNNLYGGDRGGSRYYFVMENTQATSSGNFTSGRINPGFRNKLTAFMFNTLLQYQGLELFGTYEISSGENTASDADTRTWNQFAADLIYRFGNKDQFYVGGRFNSASGPLTGTTDDVTITRLAGAAGWYMTKNVMTKLEIMSQKYDDYQSTSIFHEGEFSGFMLEAVIAF